MKFTLFRTKYVTLTMAMSMVVGTVAVVTGCIRARQPIVSQESELAVVSINGDSFANIGSSWDKVIFYYSVGGADEESVTIPNSDEMKVDKEFEKDDQLTFRAEVKKGDVILFASAAPQTKTLVAGENPLTLILVAKNEVKTLFPVKAPDDSTGANTAHVTLGAEVKPVAKIAKITQSENKEIKILKTPGGEATGMALIASEHPTISGLNCGAPCIVNEAQSEIQSMSTDTSSNDIFIYNVEKPDPEKDEEWYAIGFIDPESNKHKVAGFVPKKTVDGETTTMEIVGQQVDSE